MVQVRESEALNQMYGWMLLVVGWILIDTCFEVYDKLDSTQSLHLVFLQELEMWLRCLLTLVVVKMNEW